MDHPKDRGTSRRQFMRRAAVSAAGLGIAGAVGGVRQHDDADRRRDRCGRDEQDARRAGRPEADRARTDCRCRAPTTRSPGRSPTRTRAIAGRQAGRGRTAARLQLRRLHRPGARQAVPESSTDRRPDRDLQLLRRGDREALVRRGHVRRDHRPQRVEHRRPDRAAAAAAAQPLLPAEPREERLARAGDPFYDRGSHYTVPYVVWADGIGWRNDKVNEDIAGMDVPWDIFWHAQAYKGRSGSSTTSATRSACRCSATRCGRARGRTSTRRTRR